MIYQSNNLFAQGILIPKRILILITYCCEKFVLHKHSMFGVVALYVGMRVVIMLLVWLVCVCMALCVWISAIGLVEFIGCVTFSHVYYLPGRDACCLYVHWLQSQFAADVEADVN